MPLRNHLLLLIAAGTTSKASTLLKESATLVASIAPAAATFSANSAAGADLFPAERIQLTEESLTAADAHLSDTDVLELFGFQNSTEGSFSTKRSKRSGSCKVFPGDWNYPSSTIWKVFDLILGGALEKTTPVAAPCYKNSGVYDEAKCADVSARFMTDKLQYVDPRSGNFQHILTYSSARMILRPSCGHCSRAALACQRMTQPEHVLLADFHLTLSRSRTWPRSSWRSTLLVT